MTAYIATVGNDPAPVALGFLAAQVRGAISNVFLIYDQPRGATESERQKALRRWLEQRGVTVHEGAEELSASALNGAVFNLTGGQKPSVLPLLKLANAAGGTAMVVDAHGDELLIHNLLKKTSAPAAQHLGLQDYVDLYLPPSVQKAAFVRVKPKYSLPQFLQGWLGAQALECGVVPPAHRTDRSKTAWGGQEVTLWWVVRASRLLLVWDVRSLSQEKLQERLRLLAQKTREIGGQLATPVFWLSRAEGVLSQFILHDLRAQWIDADGWHVAALPLPVPDAAHTSGSEVKRVYAALLGEQPMPPLLGLQAQQELPDRVYLLCTPQVRLTGERLQAVLQSRPEWSGKVLLLPVEAQAPVSIQTQLDKLRSMHPDAALTLNLTGGTKALALQAELWAEEKGDEVGTEYTQGNKVYSGRTLSVPRWHLTLPEELRVRGVEISPRPLPPRSPELYQAAKKLFRKDTPEHRAALFHALQRHMPGQFQLKDVTCGLAGEYLGIAELVGALSPQRVRDMAWATRLTFPSGSVREVDGLAVLNDGRLLILEVKRNLVSGIETDQEHGQTPALGERLAGLHAHSLLVGQVPTKGQGDRWQQALRQAGPLSSPYSLWVMNHSGSHLPSGLRRFPEDLPSFLE